MVVGSESAAKRPNALQLEGMRAYGLDLGPGQLLIGRSPSPICSRRLTCARQYPIASFILCKATDQLCERAAWDGLGSILALDLNSA